MIFGEAGNDTINGGGDDDQIDGGANNDTLDGGAGNDNVNGQGGDDTLMGGIDDDSLFGAIGNDILDGGAGNNFLYGNIGVDTFVVKDGYSLDSIEDYEVGVDKVDVTGISGLDTFAELEAMMTDIGGNVEIDFGSGDILTIKGTTIQILHDNPGDFLLN